VAASTNKPEGKTHEGEEERESGWPAIEIHDLDDRTFPVVDRDQGDCVRRKVGKSEEGDQGPTSIRDDIASERKRGLGEGRPEIKDELSRHRRRKGVKAGISDQVRSAKA